MVSKDDRIKLFINELNDITEDKVRDFAKLLIENADDYFFEIAASTTGKYHPQFDLGNGGLVRHTRCVTFMAECEAKSRMFSEHDTNLLIVAALAHDMKKLGDGSGQYTVGDHPKWASDYVMSTCENNKGLLTKKDATTVANMVLSHMGQWGEKDGMPLPKTDLEKALQAADYIASRKELLGFDFRPTESVEGFGAKETPRVASGNGGPGDYVFEFGKHIGKTIKEVYEMEKSNIQAGYLMWMVKKDDFNKVDARENTMRYLDELGILPEQYKSEISGPAKAVVVENKPQKQEAAPVVYNETDEVDDLPF